MRWPEKRVYSLKIKAECFRLSGNAPTLVVTTLSSLSVLSYSFSSFSSFSSSNACGFYSTKLLLHLRHRFDRQFTPSSSSSTFPPLLKPPNCRLYVIVRKALPGLSPNGHLKIVPVSYGEEKNVGRVKLFLVLLFFEMKMRFTCCMSVQ